MKLKEKLLSLISFATIFAAMAFTHPNNSIGMKATRNAAPTVTNTFAYIGPNSPTLFSEYIDQDNYVLLNDDPVDFCPDGSDEVCVIRCPRVWNGTAWKPDFSDTTSLGNIHDQLYDFWAYGLKGLSMYLKTLEP